MNGQVGIGSGTNGIFGGGRNIPTQVGPACSPIAGSCITWSTAPPTDTLILAATNYLCNLGIIQNTQDAAWNLLPIRRHDLAKIVYLGLLGSNTTTPAEKFPTPFYDLQDSTIYYYKPAKVLSYLEYGDGISPFTRSFAHFRPSDSITRKDAAKVFAEAWNLPRASGGVSPFTDIQVGEYVYPWVKTLADSGIVYGNSGMFNASGNAQQKLTRNEAFIILYRMLQKLRKPTVHDSDFYEPHLQTPFNLSQLPGMDGGAFNQYTQTSFAINGLLPLQLGEAYNSSSLELPDEFTERSTPLYGKVYAQQAIGPGWTHSYNAYIVPVFGDTAAVNTDDRLLVHWPDGSYHFYRLPAGTGAPYLCATYGVYDSLYVGSNGYEILKKDGSVFKFNPVFIAPSVAFIAPLSAVADRHGNLLSLSYTMKGNVPVLSAVADPAGRALQFTYTDTSHPYQITGVAAATGNITRNVSFSYDSLSDLTGYTDAAGKGYQYFYGQTPLDAHLLLKIKLPRGNEINNTYAKRKLTSSRANNTYQRDVALTTDYSSSANPSVSAVVSTQRGSQTLYSATRRDKWGNLRSLSGSGMRMGAVYGDAANPKKPTVIVDSSSGITITTSYDAKGNVLSVSKAAGGLTLTESNTYNSRNDITSHTDARGKTTNYTYSGVNLSSVLMPIGTTSLSYNGNGTVSGITNPSGINTAFGYNAYGNLTSTTLAGLYANTASYDSASRIVKTTDAAGIDTRYTYDGNDNRLSERYDSVQSNILTLFGFDNNNNLTSITNALGDVTSLGYDNQDELSTQSFGGFTRTNAYNADGSLQSYASPNNTQLAYSYDADGRLTADGYAAYTYYADGKPATISHNGKTLSFRYDSLKRPAAIAYSDFAADTVKYSYDAAGNVTQIIYPGSAFTANYAYDDNNRLTSVKDGSNNTLAAYTYLTDGRLSQQSNGNGTSALYFYDAAGRPDSIANIFSSGSLIAGYGFTKDALGNHLTETNNIPGGLPWPAFSSSTVGGAYSYNRVQSYAGQSYTLDSNGNHKTSGSAITYSWDSKDNLLGYSSAALTAGYEYDGTEARRRRNGRRYVLDPLHNNNVLMETDTLGNPLAIYVHGAGLVCRIMPGTGAASYYHSDYRGSTTAVTSASQSVTHRYLYGAFGEQYGVQESGFANPFRYVGKYGVMYEDSLLYFMRARYYQPELGRFLGEDPVWGTNLYVYCENNPVTYVDFNGKDKWPIVDDAKAAVKGAGAAIKVGAAAVLIPMSWGLSQINHQANDDTYYRDQLDRILYLPSEILLESVKQDFNGSSVQTPVLKIYKKTYAERKGEEYYRSISIPTGKN